MLLIPSVTEVIRPWISFTGIPRDVLAAAADRGTAAHAACFALAGKLDPGPLDDDIQGYARSFGRWLKDCVDVVVLVETRLVHPSFAYHGEIDLIVRLKDGKVALIDIKTPVMSSKTWAVQVAAYRTLAEAKGIKTDKAGWIQPAKDGNVPRVAWAKDSNADMVIFLQMLNIHKYMKGA